MVAVQRTARVLSSTLVGVGTRHLTFKMVDGGPLGFIGGQYVIIDSGLVLTSGKLAKRAYSVLSADSDQARFEIAVIRIPEGPCSGYMHDLAPGAEVRFSGPWGKLFPAESAGGSTLVLATDTGVTAAVGLVRSQRFAPLRSACTFVWLRTSAGYFLPDDFVTSRLPEGLRETRLAVLPSIGHPERIPICQQLMREVQGRAPLGQAFIAGDGLVNYALLDDLVAAGVPATRDSVESFFNMPKKSAAVRVSEGGLCPPELVAGGVEPSQGST